MKLICSTVCSTLKAMSLLCAYETLLQSCVLVFIHNLHTLYRGCRQISVREMENGKIACKQMGLHYRIGNLDQFY